jgi:hypothetical protein
MSTLPNDSTAPHDLNAREYTPDRKYLQTGMTKREAFAMASLEGLRASKLLSDSGFAGDGVNPGYPSKIWTADAVAKQAVADADALIKALNAHIPEALR